MTTHSANTNNDDGNDTRKTILKSLGWVGVLMLIAGIGIFLRSCNQPHPAQAIAPPGQLPAANASVAAPSTPTVPAVPEDQKCSHILPAANWSTIDAPVGHYSDMIAIPAGMATATDPDLGSGKFVRECFDLLGSETECATARKFHVKSASPESVQKVYYRFCYRQ